MRTRIQTLSLTFLALGAAACSESHLSSAPPAPLHTLGILRGTVTGHSMVTEFVPIGAAGSMNSSISPAVYGGPTTVTVTGNYLNLVDHPPTRTWTFGVHMQNLLNFAIGSNYSASNSVPPDTSGVFLIFTSAPVVTFPGPCSCSVSIDNFSGTGNFSAVGQKYFWYHDRPTAVQGSPSTDTTSDLTWQFTGTFSGPDTVHAFTWVMTVSAAWPAEDDTTWKYTYNALTDSEPDLHAEPLWKPAFAQDSGLKTLGSESWTAGTGLTLTAGANSSIYFAHHDSLAPTWSAFIEADVTLPTHSDSVQAVIGWILPPATTGKQAFVGVFSDSVAFVTMDSVTGTWSELAGSGPAVTVTPAVSHNILLVKLGGGAAFFCVDHGVETILFSSSLDPPTPSFRDTHPSTVVFGTMGSSNSSGKAVWTDVLYGLKTLSLDCQ
jgi:hypothetical protein